MLGDLVREAGERGMHVDGWTVFLHVDREHDLPEGLAHETAFGDPLPTQLCPANPEVRRYAVTVAREVARRGVRAVVAESLHHHGLYHGYHHERFFVAMPQDAWFLFGLCFCRHCRALVPDGDAVRDAARAVLEAALAADDPGDGAPPPDRAGADALLDGAARPVPRGAGGGGDVAGGGGRRGVPGGGLGARLPRLVGRRARLRDGPAPRPAGARRSRGSSA